jgi:hypothetical protein
MIPLLENIRVVHSEIVWEYLDDPERTREAQPFVFGQQGGELVDLVIVDGGVTWPERQYQVQLRSVLMQLIPPLWGCFSGVEGAADAVRPIYANTVLRFAIPRAPVGVYSIELTAFAPSEAEDDLFLTIPEAIRLAPMPTSAEVNRYRTFFNPEVYSKRGPFT